HGPTSWPAPRQCRGAYQWMLDHCVRRAAADHQRAKEVFRKAGPTEDLLDDERAAGHIRGALQHCGVACHQPWCSEAKDLPKREVPRHDGEDGAERRKRDKAFRASVLTISGARKCLAFSA